MTQDASDTQVLVVGAGPTGLTMAGQLALRGVRARIIDKAPVRSDRSRALVVQPRTLELLDKVDLAESLVTAGQAAPRVSLYARGRHVARLQFNDMGALDTPFPFLLFASQVDTERVLEASLLRQGLRVERPVELVSFTEDEGGVSARLLHAGGEEVVRARYILGCDGAHSVVRKTAGLLFEGAAYEQDFALADVDIEWEGSHDEASIMLGDKGVFAVLPMKGPRAYRIIAVRAEGPEHEGDPTLEEIAALARVACPFPMRLENPRWLARFRLHHRGVDRYRAGRAFVAGDAAHIHSPAGGQGMNTGIQDAYNLAWKMALCLRGQAPEALLDTYHDERHPVGQTLLRTTDRLFSVGASRSALLGTLRNLLVPLVVPRVMGSRRLRAYFFRFIGQLLIEYPASPLSQEDLHGADAPFRRGPGKGQRAPDGPLDNGSVHGLLRGAPLHLLVFSGRGDAALDAAALRRALSELDLASLGDLLKVHLILARPPEGAAALGFHGDSSGATHERYGLAGPGLYLIRPDGYIAFRSAGAGTTSLAGYLREHFLPAR